MDLSLQTLTSTFEQADYRLQSGAAHSRVWPSGFDVLDATLNGGFRSGDLVLLAGPQGLGKTTWMLQVARNVARSGRSVVYFCYEHDQESMLIRLVALEAGFIGGYEAPGAGRIRQIFEADDGDGVGLVERLAVTYGGAEAIEAVMEYADRLLVHRSTGAATTMEVIRAAVEQVKASTGQAPMVVVDYLQKVPAPHAADEDERVTAVATGLKDMALDHDVPVLAIAASDREGLESGRRMRVKNMRGSTALAYEADVVLILNNKFDVVARHHLVYDLGNAERYRDWAVLSVEKSRSGVTGVDLEFPKRFEQSRFDTQGQRVTETLVDDRVFVE